MAQIDMPPTHWPQNYPIHENNELLKKSWALYSPCMNYRYRLRRVWGEGGRLTFCMLNPSTATELQNDPTVERCERRARAYGFGGFEVVNIFAFRSTNPKELYNQRNPIGEYNDQAILEAAQTSNATLCAWGAHGKHLDRGSAVYQLLKGFKLQHLGLTKAGAPKHPLYISYSIHPENWN